MKRLLKVTKVILVLSIILGLVLPSYATISSADGSAFLTKMEFDSAIADFRTRLTTFEAGINSKIDSQVTSYLDKNGIWSGKKQELTQTWQMQDYNWVWDDDTGSATVGGVITRTVPIGDGCSWGDVLGCLRSEKKWHLSYQDTKPYVQKEKNFTTWTEWQNHYNSNYSTALGFNSLLLAGANGTSAGTIGQIQWSPTLGTNIIKTTPGAVGVTKESISWRILSNITKSGLLFLDFGQVADFDPYININSQWQAVNWDTGLRFDFSIVFRRFNKDGVKMDDPWEEHWGDVADSKIKGTKTFIVDGVVKRVGNDKLPYSISSAQINISHFKKTINFFVAKGDKVDAIVKTVGFNHATSYLGRADWSYDPKNTEIDETTHEKGHGDISMAIHGPKFEFYNAMVY